ncbi:MAG: hypothetical protein JWO32_2547 [Bacteroidetes bacterium]|nr:hypothetical protein [Bacteroidota bacterium]
MGFKKPITMKRDTAIKMLLNTIKKEALIKITHELAQQQPTNYPLQLLNASFGFKEDQNYNWFTALGVLCINQVQFTANLLQKAHTASGYPPYSVSVKGELLNAIASGAMLTRADAG